MVELFDETDGYEIADEAGGFEAHGIFSEEDIDVVIEGEEEIGLGGAALGFDEGVADFPILGFIEEIVEEGAIVLRVDVSGEALGEVANAGETFLIHTDEFLEKEGGEQPGGGGGPGEEIVLGAGSTEEIVADEGVSFEGVDLAVFEDFEELLEDGVGVSAGPDEVEGGFFFGVFGGGPAGFEEALPEGADGILICFGEGAEASAGDLEDVEGGALTGVGEPVGGDGGLGEFGFVLFGEGGFAKEILEIVEDEGAGGFSVGVFAVGRVFAREGGIGAFAEGELVCGSEVEEALIVLPVAFGES
ncbi:MAG: hypothetical protein NTV52_01715 [Acidobacteria bacterium]|nr:hypothetical protein [Acidobacteriota bacterium]